MSGVLFALITLLVCVGGVFVSMRLYNILIRIQSKQELKDAEEASKKD